MKMLRVKGKSDGSCLSKDTGLGFSSIYPEFKSRALSKDLIIVIDRYWGLKK